jgi:hypothetical protein
MRTPQKLTVTAKVPVPDEGNLTILNRFAPQQAMGGAWAKSAN